MSEIKVNKISPRTACGTTTLGDSGDTFTIPAGVSITNNGTASGLFMCVQISSTSHHSHCCYYCDRVWDNIIVMWLFPFILEQR